MVLSLEAHRHVRYETLVPISSSTARDLNKGTVLVVDDDPEVLEALCDVLHEEGYEVMRATHGLDALRVLERYAKPDLIVLDLTMPVMDGYEFLERRTERPALAEIPVLVVSATIDAAALRPEVHVLRKPIDVETLLDAIDRATSLS